MPLDKKVLQKVVAELMTVSQELESHPIWDETGPDGALARLMLACERVASLNERMGMRPIGSIGSSLATGFYIGIRYAEEMRKREVN